MNDKAAIPGFRGLSLRLIDSALLIAIILGVLQYAGWTYRQAYLGGFGIDPSSLDSPGMSVAVEGMAAIMSTVWAWGTACAGLIATAIGCWIFVHWVERKRGNTGPIADRTAIRMIQVGGILLAVTIVLGSGLIAGRKAATNQITVVHQGDVWTYHLGPQTLAGVPVAQSKDTTWLLTKAGVRLIRTADIQLIDGPRFQRVVARVRG